MQSVNTQPWIYTSTPAAGTRMRLFCIPYAGAGAAVFRLWPDAVPTGVEVCRLQLPGRENRLRESPIDRIDQLLAPLLEAIEPLLDAPFAFFGHSMGATLAFELAHVCHERYGREAAHLLVSGQRAPQFQLEAPIHHLSDAAFIHELRTRYGGIPDALLREPELVELLLPVLRADIALCESVEKRHGTLRCPITAYGGEHDPWVAEEHLRGWGDQTTADFRFELFDGDHFFLDGRREAVLGSVYRALARTMRTLEG